MNTTAVAARFVYEPRTICICGAPLAAARRSIEKSYPWGPVRFVACAICRTWIQSPRITTTSLASWFDSREYREGGAVATGGTYLDYGEGEAARRVEARARYERDLHPFLPSRARVLEVGCATGSVLSVLRDAGHVVQGLDLSEEFVKEARRRYGLDARAEDFATFGGEDSAYDAILILGTYPNLPELEVHLSQVRRLLRPRGLLYLNTPIADAFISRLYGSHSWMFKPSVQQFPTARGCRLSLTRAGFELVRFRGDAQMPTLSKVLAHAQLRTFFPLAKSLGLASCAPPFLLPIPGVRVALARAGR